MANRDDTPDVERIAAELGGRPAGEGRYVIRCVVHDDRRPSGVIHDTGDGVALYCYAGCSPSEMRDALRSMGLWPERRAQSHGRGPSRAELEREAIRHAVDGTRPRRRPPYSREIPSQGDVTIICAADTWPLRPVPSLVLPPGEPWAAYRWPVDGRRVHVIDLATSPPPGERHYGRVPWRADPWQWAEDRRQWLRAAARLLIRRDGAEQVRVVSSADRCIYRREEAGTDAA